MKFLSSFLHLLPYLDKHHKDFELGTDEMLFLGQFAQRLAFCFSGKTSSRISFTGRMSKYWNNIKSSCLRLCDALTNKNHRVRKWNSSKIFWHDFVLQVIGHVFVLHRVVNFTSDRMEKWDKNEIYCTLSFVANLFQVNFHPLRIVICKTSDSLRR